MRSSIHRPCLPMKIMMGDPKACDIGKAKTSYPGSNEKKRKKNPSFMI